MDHIVLNVEEDEKMVAFYTEVLMMAPERLEAYHADKVPFPSVRLGPGTVIDLFPKKLWQKQPAADTGGGTLNHFCIALERQEWEALLLRLQAAGVAIETGPVPRWGARGSGTSVYFRDPEKNLIEARYYEEPDRPESCLLGS